MKVQSSLLLLLLLVLTPSVLSIKLLDDLLHLKDEVVGGVKDLLGKGNCGCACRDYWVPKCEMTYQQKCHEQYYEQVCESVAVPSVTKAKETECQKCRKYYVTVPVTKWVKECNPVYDEKCVTKYDTHCKTQQKCVTVYQTQCATSYDGYQNWQQCHNEPKQHCYPETVCHKTPLTSCVPVKKEDCQKVAQQATEQQERSQCLPFERSPADLEALLAVDPCGGLGLKAHDHAHSAPAVSTGYGQPATDYGQPATDYGQQATSYGQPATDYGQQSTDYGLPALPALPDLPKLPFELPSLEPAPTNYGAASAGPSHIVLEPMSSSYVAPPPAAGFAVDATDSYGNAINVNGYNRAAGDPILSQQPAGAVSTHGKRQLSSSSAASVPAAANGKRPPPSQASSPSLASTFSSNSLNPNPFVRPRKKSAPANRHDNDWRPIVGRYNNRAR